MNLKIITLIVGSLLLELVAAANETDSVNDVLDQFHQAAAEADFETYFSLFTDDGVFIGTDASERWTVDEFKAYAKPHFDAGKGWTFTPKNRHINHPKNFDHASFDELLTSKAYGLCRGTGVVRKVGDQWKIEQYHLTIPIPNEQASAVVELIKAQSK